MLSWRAFLRLLGGGAAALGAGCLSRPTRPAEADRLADAAFHTAHLFASPAPPTPGAPR